MAIFNKFNDFSEQLVRGIHDWDNHTFKVMLSAVAPVATNAIKSELVEISAINGYTAGGISTTISISEADGLTTLQGTQVVFTASGGSMPSFRYIVLYNSTAASENLIGWWDYGQSLIIPSGDTFTVKFNNSSPGTILTLG